MTLNDIKSTISFFYLDNHLVSTQQILIKRISIKMNNLVHVAICSDDTELIN